MIAGTLFLEQAKKRAILKMIVLIRNLWALSVIMIYAVNTCKRFKSNFQIENLCCKYKGIFPHLINFECFSVS